MLKSKNQVTLFVNYSCNSFYDFRSSENIYKADRGVLCQIMGFSIFYIWWLYMNIPLTDIHAIASGPAIRESVDSLCRDGADAQYMQYLSKSRITSPQTRKKLI